MSSNPVILPRLQSMIPERTIFGDGANYGVPLAARLSDSMPSVCSFDIPSIGAVTLDSTVGPARQAISRTLLRTALFSLAVLIFGQRTSVSRCLGTSPRCKLNRRRHVRDWSDRSRVESLRSAEVLGQDSLCSAASISRTRCTEVISIGYSGGASIASLRRFTIAGIRNRHGQPVTRHILHKHASSRPAPSTPLPPASARAASAGRSGDDQLVARSREYCHGRPWLGGRPQSQAHCGAAGSTGATTGNPPISKMCCTAKGSGRLSLGRECDYLMSTDWAAKPSGTACRSYAWPKSSPILS